LHGIFTWFYFIFGWLFAFVFSLGCVYLCSHLPCTFVVLDGFSSLNFIYRVFLLLCVCVQTLWGDNFYCLSCEERFGWTAIARQMNAFSSIMLVVKRVKKVFCPLNINDFH
jgi:hypothetical protein